MAFIASSSSSANTRSPILLTIRSSSIICPPCSSIAANSMTRAPAHIRASVTAINSAPEACVDPASMTASLIGPVGLNITIFGGISDSTSYPSINPLSASSPSVRKASASDLVTNRATCSLISLFYVNIFCSALNTTPFGLNAFTSLSVYGICNAAKSS